MALSEKRNKKSLLNANWVREGTTIVSVIGIWWVQLSIWIFSEHLVRNINVKSNDKKID